MRALDRHTIETLGVPGALLMESAGRAVAEVVLAERAAAGGGPVLVVCGAGNNGGDGFVVARLLHAIGVPVRVALVGERRKLRGDAAANAERVERCGVAIEAGALRTAGASVIVDALFGTGLARDVAGAPAAAIRRMRAARPAARVVAVDLPSGLDADTGQVHAIAVQADVTVTIGLPKPGLVLEPGRSLAGRVVVARIGIADAAPGVEGDAVLWSARGAAERLPGRPSHGHKGSFGHALVVAGSRGKTGAAALAAEGAARIGSGLVTIACPASTNEILEVKCTEMMTAPVADTPDGGLASSALAALVALARERDVVALGPGVGREAETQKLVRSFAERCARPLVIDADGLFPFARDALTALKSRKAATILTPHPGEAARLLGVPAAEINRDRVGAARRLATEAGSVVLLKGAASVIAAPDGRTALNPTGGPVLGSGGTGDVLTGVVVGLLAQGVDAFEAAALGAWVHGFAGDRLAARRGESGVLASDVAGELPEACAALREIARGAAEPDALALPFP
ncbi:MAG: bifunctional ADP-dependent NAD(P)H-hydrate dehydratase/NAD(P)H-hydrate epimerase [Proteobacteria bacterium]|nr:MAG: bifunctional ADP-dependent NAD(P)H-hydrate dehydratase/NAD(P)H-hydrate epimerase [Pseudomonadota bacterium]